MAEAYFSMTVLLFVKDTVKVLHVERTSSLVSVMITVCQLPYFQADRFEVILNIFGAVVSVTFTGLRLRGLDETR